MKTLTFAAVAMMATALHAQPLEDIRLMQEMLSGTQDITVLIVELPRRPEPACRPSHRDQRELQVVTRLGKVFVYRPCTVEGEDEARYNEELWARDVRHLLGDPGRH